MKNFSFTVHQIKQQQICMYVHITTFILLLFKINYYELFAAHIITKYVKHYIDVLWSERLRWLLKLSAQKKEEYIMLYFDHVFIFIFSFIILLIFVLIYHEMFMKKHLMNASHNIKSWYDAHSIYPFHSIYFSLHVEKCLPVSI